MIGFVIAAAILLAAALAIVLPPMLRTAPPAEVERKKINVAIGRERLAELEAAREAGTLSNEDFERERRDLEESLLEDIQETTEKGNSKRTGRWAAFSVLLMVPILSISLYVYLGMPAVFQVQTMQSQATQQESLPTIEQMVGELERRLEQDPGNVEGWSMLARTYMVMGQYEKAANALYKVQDLVGENPDVLVDIADALAMQQGGRLDGKPIELLRQALASNSSQLKALWLIGMYEFQQGNAADALVHWRRLEPMLFNDPDSQQELRKLIVRAEEQTGDVKVPVEVAEPAVTTNGSLVVTVSMSADMIGKFSPDDTLFIFARAKSGPPMPLAVYRGRASELPVEVTLDDSMAMTPMMKLSGFQDVSVMARISKTGQAKPAPGDLYGVAPGSIVPGQQAPVTILIDQVQG